MAYDRASALGGRGGGGGGGRPWPMTGQCTGGKGRGRGGAPMAYDRSVHQGEGAPMTYDRSVHWGEGEGRGRGPAHGL